MIKSSLSLKLLSRQFFLLYTAITIVAKLSTSLQKCRVFESRPCYAKSVYEGSNSLIVQQMFRNNRSAYEWCRA